MSPYEAYRNALINGPSKKTRKIACKDPWPAYFYAKYIDKKPKENTRKIACKDLKIAYLYAEDIDKGFHEVTWETVKNTEYEEIYKKFFNSTMKEEII